jgi:F420-0:gamma-glutamyl ligase
LQGQTSEGKPVVLVRGFDFAAYPSATARPAADLIRDISEDMFR